MNNIDKFNGIHYRNMTEEQLDSMEGYELVNKFLSDDVDEVIMYHDKTIFMRKNLIGSLLLSVFSVFVFGFMGLFSLFFVGLFIFMYFKNNNHFIWSVKSLKVTVAMYRGNSHYMKNYDYIFDNQLNRINHINIGELYERVS